MSPRGTTILALRRGNTLVMGGVPSALNLWTAAPLLTLAASSPQDTRGGLAQ